MSIVGDLFTTAKLVITLEDRVTAIAKRVEAMEAREAALRERLVRVESILEMAVFNSLPRLGRD